MTKDLIYGIGPQGGLVFMERSKALENIAFWEAKTWGDFHQSAPGLYKWAVEQLDAEEDALPEDSDELDHMYFAADGDFPYFAEQLMLDFIPASVQQKYGEVEMTVLNGAMLKPSPSHESEIVGMLRSQGFSCERDQGLVDAIYQV